MGEFDIDVLVLETVRRHTGNDSAGAKSRFVEDLRLSDNGRRTLFAYLTEAFTARGLNLPSRGFYLSEFLACATPAEVQAAIRDTLAGVRKKTPGRAMSPLQGAPTPAPAPQSGGRVAPEAPKKAQGAAPKKSAKPSKKSKAKSTVRKGRARS